MTSLDVQTAAKPIREEAADWLLRKSADSWDDAQQEQFENWLAASEYHRAAYWRLEAAWTEATRLAALRPAAGHSPRLEMFLSPRLFRAIAAGLLVAVAGAGSYRYMSVPREQIFATPVGGHRTLTLPDRTIIELNTDTIVSVPYDLSQRKASLIKGEAYFEIAHDARHPFVVTVGNHKVTDLGTKFLISNSGKRVEVALLEGRARLDAVEPGSVQRSTELSPGEIATATKDSMSVTKRPMKSLSDEVSWRKGLLIFDGTALGDAVADFNRYNIAKIIVRDPAISQLRINGTFPVHDGQEFVDVARAVFGLRVKPEGSNTLITH